MSNTYKMQAKELHELHQLNDWRNTFAILFDYSIIVASIWGAITLKSLIFYPVFMILIARSQHALFILSHDAVHHRLYKNRKVNDFMGQAISIPMFFMLKMYREIHLKHHQNPHNPDDPNPISGDFPMKANRFYRQVIFDLIGISYIQMVSTLMNKNSPYSIPEKHKPEFRMTMLIGSMINFTLAAIFIKLGYGIQFFVLWWFPLVTILQSLMRIRSVAEHGGLLENEDQSYSSRTVINPIQNFFFAPHAVFYHIEHHLYPAVPWYNLKKLHQTIHQDLPKENQFTSYRDVFSSGVLIK